MHTTTIFSVSCFLAGGSQGILTERVISKPPSSQCPLLLSFPNASPSFTLSLEVALAVDAWVLEKQRCHQADDPPASQDPLSLSSPEHP